MGALEPSGAEIQRELSPWHKSNAAFLLFLNFFRIVAFCRFACSRLGAGRNYQFFYPPSLYCVKSFDSSYINLIVLIIVERLVYIILSLP